MNPADDKTSAPGNTAQPKQVPFPVGKAFGKEQEIRSSAGSEQFTEVAPKLEVPEEVEKAGVTKIGETIELPPDVRKLGMTHTGQATPVSTTSQPTVSLPISDQQVLVGLNVQVANALRWLAEWCLKKLKKAHLALKIVKGKVVRVKAD